MTPTPEQLAAAERRRRDKAGELHGDALRNYQEVWRGYDLETLAAPPVAADIAEAKSVMAKMTPGEWDADTLRGSVWSDRDGCWVADCNDSESAADNAAGIAYLRNNAPAWLDQIDRLRAANERMRAALQTIADFPDVPAPGWLMAAKDGLKIARAALAAPATQPEEKAAKERCDCPDCHGTGLVGKDYSACGCVIAGCRKFHTHNPIRG